MIIIPNMYLADNDITRSAKCLFWIFAMFSSDSFLLQQHQNLDWALEEINMNTSRFHLKFIILLTSLLDLGFQTLEAF